MTEHSLARRDVIKAAGAGLATSLLAGATAAAQTPAAAQTSGILDRRIHREEGRRFAGDLSQAGRGAYRRPRSRCCSWSRLVQCRAVEL